MNQEEAKRLLDTSGNKFHCRVAQYFREKKWRFLMSPYYIDPSTDKAREVDLIVEKDFYVPEHFGGSPIVVCMRLLVECKYIPTANGALFWFSGIDLRSAVEWVTDNTPFSRKHSTLYRQHHLATRQTKGAREPVAKLFQSNRDGNFDQDPMYKAINQCLSGYVNNRARDVPSKRAPNVKVIEIAYPVIVCSQFDNFYRTDVVDQSDPVLLTSNFQLEINFAYMGQQGRSREEYMLIDLVQFSELDTFLNTIEEEAKAATELLETN
jgi:hypothetical protein